MKVNDPHFSPENQSSNSPRKEKKAKVSGQNSGLEVDLTRDVTKRAKLLSADPCKLSGAFQEPTSTVEAKSQSDRSGKLSSPSGFHEKEIDPCTGRTFFDLMREKFDDERPYCFASAVPSNTAPEKKIFLDGKSVISGISRTPLARPIRILVKDIVMSFSEVHLFCARRSRSIESMGSLSDFQTHSYFLDLHQFVTQERSDLSESEYHEERAEVDLSIALLFGAGIGVKTDPEYAELLRRRIGPKLLTTALAREFTHVATIQSDTRLAEHLLAIEADPTIPDPDDDYSAVAMARKHDNRPLLGLFRSRGVI